MTARRALVTLAQWLGLGAVVGVGCGAASALFLALLDAATSTRQHHEWIVFGLPLAGLALGALYARFGASIWGGTNLVIDTIHDGGPAIPLRMFPMVLAGTVVTHLFGGSAGREGTAVQMGAIIADHVAHRCRLAGRLRQQLIVAGVAGGFGAVFGTPIAGTVFGLEVVVLGRIRSDAFVPALVAAIVGDLTTRALGIGHTPYPAVLHAPLTPSLCLAWLAFAAVLALVIVVFIELTQFLRRQAERHIPTLALRMAIGGAIIVVLWQLLGTSAYLGLGIPTIVQAFREPGVVEWAFAAKLGFTAITLAAGFIGGEVTPLFFIGAALGSVLAPVLGIPRELGAGVGMAAAFAIASNTPLALSVMAVELLGAAVLPHVVIVCVLAYLMTGQRSIYPAQRVTRGKGGGTPAAPVPLRAVRARPPPPPARDPPASE
ncbi:MAG: chloride channel protein [Myxococcota bacterium]|nr:chloride channel protein [Myxococcota bacterium]